jgi:hypothetical protein
LLIWRNIECAPGRIRTADHLVRSQVLYPAELRAQARSLAAAAPFGNPIPFSNRSRLQEMRRLGRDKKFCAVTLECLTP